MSSNKYFILKGSNHSFYTSPIMFWIIFIIVISAQIPGLWKFRLPWYRRTVNRIKRKKTHPSSIVEISFNDVIQKTGVAENTTSPEWNESFLMFVSIFIRIFISYSFADIFVYQIVFSTAIESWHCHQNQSWWYLYWQSWNKSRRINRQEWER